MSFPWGHERRFNSYPEYFRKLFGNRVQKVSVDAGLTCPNRDGTVGTGGCTFCNNDAFNPSYCNPVKPVKQQLEEGINFHKFRYRRVSQYLAYFQTYSNTYASLEKLKELYTEALSVPGIIGLIIATRPDCMSPEKWEYLSELSKKVYLSLEFGIESVRNETLRRVNRGHTIEQSIQAFNEAKRYGLRCGAHFIIGLPGEDKESFLADIETIAGLGMDSIKFHQLQIFSDTAIAQDYLRSPDSFHLYALEEYLELVVKLIERLSPACVVERIASEVPPRYQLNEGWGQIRYDEVQRRFEKKLEEQNSWQGKYYKSNIEINICNE
ncbi:MAG: TIGR01212 family radical SAM protein [Bacteroidales bacterium]